MRTVKDVKERILFLENCIYNLNNLQKYIKNNEPFDEDKHIVEAIKQLENKANLNISLDILCFNVINCIEHDIKRLNILIDDAIVIQE